VPSVARISVTPVKNFALEPPAEVLLTEHGVLENRRFYVVEPDGTRFSSSGNAWPNRFRARYDPGDEVLYVRLPNGEEVEGSARGNGHVVRSEVSGREVEAEIVEGPWTEALSAAAGKPARLARACQAGDTYQHVASLLSLASIERLAEEAGEPVDARRFRMLFMLDGCEAHEEDTWNGRLVRVGDAVIRVGGPIPRCAVTTRDPDTGRRDLDTLRLIDRYRGQRRGQPPDFGVYGDVVEPGRVRVGDSVEPL
jgi:uncharacterized protein YcbX